MSKSPRGFPKRTRWSREFDSLHRKLIYKLGTEAAQVPEDPAQFAPWLVDNGRNLESLLGDLLESLSSAAGDLTPE